MTNELHVPILITGGTGFAGSHLVEYLLELGFTNVHVTTYAAKNSFVEQLLPASQVHQLNLTDLAATLSLFQQLQPQQIYHLAAFASVGTSYDKAVQTMSNNSLLQWSVLEALRLSCPTARLLAVGSAQEYDFFQIKGEQTIDEQTPLGPINPYGVSKVDQDLLALSYAYSYDLDIVRVRPFNHTGERQTREFAIPEFARQIVAIEKGEQSELQVGNLSVVRDMSDVKDVVKAYVSVMKKGNKREVYNIGSGQGHSMQEILELLISQASIPVHVVQDASRLRPLDVPYVVANIDKITALGWQPQISLTATVARVLEYWRTL